MYGWGSEVESNAVEFPDPCVAQEVGAQRHSQRSRPGLDGAQRSMKWSLQARLSLWLSGAILIVALVAGTLSFGAAFDEAIEMQDHLLTEMGLLTNLRGRRFDAGGRFTPPDGHGSGCTRRHMAAPHVGFGRVSLRGRANFRRTWRASGLTACRRPRLPAIRGASMWRRTSGANALRLASAPPCVSTSRATAHGVLLAPLVLLIPILLILVALVVARMFKPLKAASAALARRSEQDLTGIDFHSLPTEIHPFVRALNGLLTRTSLAMYAQRRFVADAAHELRSPMTALSLQAERASEATTIEDASERLLNLRNGLRRARQLLDQLLGLAPRTTG